MCHLFSVVFPYALSLLRRRVPGDLWDQRETGDPSATCWLVSHQQINLYKGITVMGWGQLSAYMVLKALVPQRWGRPDFKGGHLKTERKRRVGLLGDSLQNTWHWYQINRFSLAMQFPFFLGMDLYKLEKLVGVWYLQPLYFLCAKNTLQTLVLFSIITAEP